MENELNTRAAAWFEGLQQRILTAFESLEPNGATFTRTSWKKSPEERLQGSGVIALMKGDTFEKVGVNFSHVHGTFPEPFRKEIPGTEESEGRFWASGVSLVAHMKNPFTPSVHMNVRRICTSKGWFGGGADLTPTFPFPEDTAHFHNTLKAACEGQRPGSYEEYRKWCAEYFMLPHRNQERGVGGVFFDYLDTGSPEADLAFTQAVGDAFLRAFTPLVSLRMNTPYTAEDKHAQNIKRGLYAEFNLLYDRGTRFGLQSGGNPEAILMSLPPPAVWE